MDNTNLNITIEEISKVYDSLKNKEIDFDGLKAVFLNGPDALWLNKNSFLKLLKYLYMMKISII